MRHIPALAYLKPEEIRDTFLFLKKKVLSKEVSAIVSWISKYNVNGTLKNITNTATSKTFTNNTTPISVNSKNSTIVPI